MKKIKPFRFLWIVCIFLVIGFGIRVGVDLVQFSEADSVLFSAKLLLHCIEFLLPAAILLCTSLILRRKEKNAERNDHGRD